MKDEISRLVEWIREYVEKAGAEGVVLGMSGGVDSAVVAALAARAVGPEKIMALALPCGSSPDDELDARAVADQLGIELSVRPFPRIHKALMKISGYDDPDALDGLVAANLKSRLRMAMLYIESNEMNYLVIGTTNKSEFAVGYFTKWGDGAVDFEPLLNFYKTEVVEMARELGLPEHICTRTPSPGNQPGVTDEKELDMTYKVLDETLKGMTGDDRKKYTDSHPGISARVADLVLRGAHKNQRMPAFQRK